MIEIIKVKNIHGTGFMDDPCVLCRLTTCEKLFNRPKHEPYQTYELVGFTYSIKEINPHTRVVVNTGFPHFSHNIAEAIARSFGFLPYYYYKNHNYYLCILVTQTNKHNLNKLCNALEKENKRRKQMYDRQQEKIKNTIEKEQTEQNTFITNLQANLQDRYTCGGE